MKNFKKLVHDKSHEIVDQAIREAATLANDVRNPIAKGFERDQLVTAVTMATHSIALDRMNEAIEKLKEVDALILKGTPVSKDLTCVFAQKMTDAILAMNVMNAFNAEALDLMTEEVA